MKNFFKRLSGYGIVFFGFFACVGDDDFKIPVIHWEEPQVEVNTDIATVLAMYRGFEPKRIETGPDSQLPMFLEAYVVSSDESGNIYKSLVIQDAPENPTAGVAVSTHSTNLYTRFEPGRKVYLRVDGLYVGAFAGLPSIGILDGNEVGRIDVFDFEKRIFRSQEFHEISPDIIDIPQALTKTNLNTLIQLQDVQFPEELAGILHYGNLTNTFGVNRPVEDCNENRIILRTSGFSNFKNLQLPEGNGTLTAVLSVFGNDVQLLIRDPRDVQFLGERCSP